MATRSRLWTRDDETLIYTLGGRDAAMFDIDSSDDDTTTPPKVAGQLKTKAELDYETNKKSYMVTVIADDSTGESNATGSITVTIYVTNVDEAPTVSGRSMNFTYPENGKDPVTTLTASDPEGVGTTVWDLLIVADATTNPQDINGDGTDDVEEEDAEDIGRLQDKRRWRA